MATRLQRRAQGGAAAAWRLQWHRGPLAFVLLLGMTVSGLLCGAAAVRVPNPLTGRRIRPPDIASVNATSTNALAPLLNSTIASRQLFSTAPWPGSGLDPGDALGNAPAPVPAVEAVVLLHIQAENSTTPSGNTTATDGSLAASPATSALLRAALLAVLILGSVAICGALLPLYVFPCPDPFKVFFLPLVFGMGTPHNGATTVVVTGA
jgi:hypothetical protein